MNEVRNTSFTALANLQYDVNRAYKQYQRTFSVARTIAALTADSYSVQIQVSWTVNGKGHTHNVTSIVSRGI
jgi:hypothetical protein